MYLLTDRDRERGGDTERDAEIDIKDVLKCWNHQQMVWTRPRVLTNACANVKVDWCFVLIVQCNAKGLA